MREHTLDEFKRSPVSEDRRQAGHICGPAMREKEPVAFSRGWTSPICGS